MANSKFKVGQTVDLLPARGVLPSSGRGYKIIRVLPCEHGEPQYRIKATTEAFERVAKECDLTIDK